LLALYTRYRKWARGASPWNRSHSRWRNEGVPIPEWVPKHLTLLLEIKRLSDAYLVPAKTYD
jgi:hypothetical protein